MNHAWHRYLPVIIREWIQGRQHVRKTIGNTGWLLFDRILRMGVGMIIGAWVARYLGPAQFGELAYVIAFIAFFRVIASLQADGFIVRDISQERGDASLILGTALKLRLLFGVFSWMLAVLLMFVLHPKDGQLLILTCIIGAMIVFEASDTVDLWFQSQSQNKRTVTAKLVAYVLSTSIKIILLLLKAPLVAFAGVMTLECAASALGLYIAYRRFPTPSLWKASFNQARALLAIYWPFIVSGLMVTIFSRIDQIMLKEMLGERELGIYAAALSISQAWTVIPSTLLTSLAPFISQKMAQNEEAYKDALATIFRFFVIISIVVASITAFTSSWIITLLYGSQYQSSSVILSTHVFVNVFVFQGMAQYLWVINNNVRAVTMFGTFLSVIVGIIANAILIRKFGVMGAAFSALLTECVSVVIIPCLLRRDLFDLYRRAFIPKGYS